MDSVLASLANLIPHVISGYLVWWIAALIVAVGLLAFGREDLSRLEFRRIWAISSVGFAESIRRRILWVTPLAILGVIAIGQLQHADDEQEAIRQTIKFCLLASALLVTVTAIILACTNLPREIENRVIFTIVTKPTTRLEIVLGKVLGFARVSAAIILIMGLFTFGYLELRSWRLGNHITARMETERDPTTLATLQTYRDTGLLSTKSLDRAQNLQIYDRTPSGTDTQVEAGGLGYYFIVPFEITAQDRDLLESSQANLAIATLRLQRHTPTKKDLEQIRDRRLPLEPQSQMFGPSLAPSKVPEPKPIPQVSFILLDENLALLSNTKETAINDGKSVGPMATPPDGSPYVFAAPLPPELSRKLLEHSRFYLEVLLETPSVEYEVGPMPVVLNAYGGKDQDHIVKPAADPLNQAQVAPPQFLTRGGRFGLKVAGSADGKGSVAVFHFRGVEVPKSADGNVEFRFRAGVERGGDFDASKAFSMVQLNVVNHRTGQTSPPIPISPETNHDYAVQTPAAYVQGGDFDVYVRGMDDGQWLGLQTSSLQYVVANRSFALNLLKSSLILWLMSILVVIVSVFTSTFLSWPIAVVLTLVILLGHWGVEQLGDALNPGIGRTTATDLGFRDPDTMKVVSSSVDALSRMLTAVSVVLPDVGKFPVSDDIERGVSIPGRHILEALGVLVSYGLPMLVLSFVILKNKEVAP